MILTLDRKYKKDKYTIGKLYINGKYFCDTCEDKDRGINNKQSLSDIKRVKIKDETAIPTGQYKVTLNVISPKFSNFIKYPQYKFTGGKLPRLLNVPGFDGILMHEGKNAKWSSGCILVGKNNIVGGLTDSRQIFQELYQTLKSANDKNEDIIITIK